jgi:glycerol-3-phosphate dehydrogenase (NAD(P)+)
MLEMPGYKLPQSVSATSDLEEAVRGADVLIMAIPSQSFRDVLVEGARALRPWVPVVSLTKGLEQGTRLRMSQVAEEVLPGHPFAVLTGPNLAKEILAGDAAASVVATHDPVVAGHLQRIIESDLSRVYTNPDVIGSEVGGALKNVIATAAGMADQPGGRQHAAAVITAGWPS